MIDRITSKVPQVIRNGDPDRTYPGMEGYVCLFDGSSNNGSHSTSNGSSRSNNGRNSNNSIKKTMLQRLTERITQTVSNNSSDIAFPGME